MHFETYEQAISQKASSDDLLGYVVERLAQFNDGKDVELDFMSRAQVGRFCEASGIGRNWAALTLDEIAPKQPEGVQAVPEDEAIVVLSQLKCLVEKKILDPSADGDKAPTLLNDFLPEGESFQGETCLGHLWEFRYALAVELEHGTTRGTNVTNNHPLLTGMVVMAHLAEDSLYYARLWVMETQGELFTAQLEGSPSGEILDTLRHLSLAEKHLQARLSEKVDAAKQ